ncbi:MAG: glycosyltransferase [Chloroflexota bacterium]
MHILHVTPYYAPAYAFGGVTRSVEGMATALAQRGHQVTVLTTDAHTANSRITPPRDNLNGVNVLRARNTSVWLRGHMNLSTPLTIRRLAQSVVPDVDVVHCHEFRTVENLLVTPIAAAHNKPLALSPHGTLPHGTGRSLVKQVWDRLLSPQVARRFDAVIALAQPEQDDAQALWQTFDAASVHQIIPNGVDMSQFEHLPDAQPFKARYDLRDSHVILFMGRLHPRKGVDVLARAFTQMTRPDVRLLIVGPDEGLMDDLQTLAQQDARIVLTGFLEGEDRLAAFAASDIFTLPAVGEGLPMAVLEAMATGLPVIISPGCNLPEVTTHGAGVEVVVNEQKLQQAIEGLVADDDLRTRMATTARDLVREHFTWEAVAAQLDDGYTALMNT